MKWMFASVAFAGVIAGTLPAAGQARRDVGCAPEAWAGFEGRVTAAQARFQQREPEPMRVLWSHADDVTLPPVPAT